MKYISFLLLLLTFNQARTQQTELITFNGELHLTLNQQVVMVKFQPNTANEIRTAAFDPAYFEEFDIQKNKAEFNYAFVNLKAGLSPEMIFSAVASLSLDPNIVYTSAMYNQDGGELCAPTNKLFAKLVSPEMIISVTDFLVTNYGASFAGYSKENFAANLFKLEFNITNTVELFAIADELFTTGYFEYCEPNMVVITKKLTDDTYYDYQWAINNTGSEIQYNGTPGADVDALCAWEFTRGAGSTVAILDEGVDLDHEDLMTNLLPGYDAVFWGGGDVDNSSGGYEPGSDDAHGTNCAGIVCAIADNGIGVTGVAPESNVVPVRIAYSNWWGWVLEYDWVADAVEWSVDNASADILSNSYQLGAEPSVVSDAIDYAITSGRGGLGSIFVAAAGNYNDNTLVFPGKYENSIGVAASSMCDERKSYTSCDGENFWGSNYGSKLDVAAPGVKIPSTDISGGAGYDGGNYYLQMNGTSAATPHTAAVLALMISLDPTLTYEDARYILESTCEKVGGYTYDDLVAHPSGTWSNDLGYGRINACLALEAVTANLIKPDIAGTIDAISADIVNPGETIDVDYIIQNDGFTDAGAFDNTFLLSSDCALGDDVAMESYATASLAVDEVINYSNTITIPENTTAGAYKVLLSADNGLVIEESLEINNVACVDIVVQCSYSPEGGEAYYDYLAVTDSFNIITTSACDWSITPAPPAWIDIINGSGTGNGYFTYTLEENDIVVERSFTFHYGAYDYVITQNRMPNSIDELSVSLAVYPNPASDQLIVEGDFVEAQYTIMNILGENISGGEINGDEHTIDIHDLAAGTYLLQLTIEGETIVKDFIKF